MPLIHAKLTKTFFQALARSGPSPRPNSQILKKIVLSKYVTIVRYIYDKRAILQLTLTTHVGIYIIEMSLWTIADVVVFIVLLCQLTSRMIMSSM